MRCFKGIQRPVARALAPLILLQKLLIVVLASTSLGHAHGPCVQAFTHTPVHERIFLPKTLVKEQPTVAGLTTTPFPGETNLIARLFDDPTKERAGLIGSGCAAELPLAGLKIRCAGDLLNTRNIAELLNCTVVVPRKHWVDHQTEWKRTGRYVFVLSDSAGEEFTIELREGGCAVVFFPDHTYRCIMDRGYACVQSLQPAAAPSVSVETNLVSGIAVTNLIERKQEFQGKRVEIKGYYWTAFEASQVSDGHVRGAATSSLWVAYYQVKPGSEEKVKWAKEGFVRIVGTLKFRPGLGSGHLGGWPAEITDLEVFELIE